MGLLKCIGFHDSDTGSKLVLRNDPPANGVAYEANEPGRFLGYCVGRVSLPRWMSSQFSAAISDGVDLTKYSDDWTEKLFYVPNTGEPPSRDEKDLIDILCDIFISLEHLCANGCSDIGPRTILQAVSLGKDGNLDILEPDSSTYYTAAAVRKPDNLVMVAEWAIASEADRPKFENSKWHAEIIKAALARRYYQDHKLRTELFKTIQNLPDEFKP